MTEIRVPTLGESVTEATIGKWFKKPGDAVAVDEPLVELETDKVTIEVPAPAAGVLADIAAKDGETVAVGALLGQIKDGARVATGTGAPDKKQSTTAPIKAGADEIKARPQDKLEMSTPKPSDDMPKAAGMPAASSAEMPPSVRKLSAESGVDASTVAGSGKDGRVTKGDMMAARR